MNEARLGVFICECGDRIASVLDVDALVQGASQVPGVSLARKLAYPCSPDGRAAIAAAYRENGLDRVLVAGCTPRLLERHFQKNLRQAGLDGDLFELVDVREGCAWVHPDDPPAATEKALELIKMGVARLALRRPAQPSGASVSPGALVVGGGLSGMTAALMLASGGQHVTLVERQATLGGMLREAGSLLPGGGPASDLVAQKAESVLRHPQIQVLLGSEVTGVTGTVGRYSVAVNGGERLEVGAIVVASGAQTLEPWGKFRYGDGHVVTQLAFERDLQEASSLSDVVMILCAAQRDEDIPYCSGVCCVAALRQALEVKAANAEAQVTVLFRDLNLLGESAHEKKVSEARRAGVRFVRYAPSSPPKVTAGAVEVHDVLSGADLRLPYDRVVLATPLVPQPDAGVLAHRLGIEQDENGFFPEVRYRLRPENYAQRGIYVCGAAHSPAPPAEAELQATSAAFKALQYLRSGHVGSQAPVAVVEETLCTGCGTCVQSCPFGAISLQKRDMALDLSQIDALKCTGCGNCVVVCPVKAIAQPVGTDQQVLAQIDATLATRTRDGRPRILVFGCEWSSHAAAELAGANKLVYPSEARLIRMRCSARFDPIHVLWALFSGADGVFLGACPPGDCHYVEGNRNAQERYETLRQLLAQNGFDPRRLRLEWIKPDDAGDFVGKITDFATLVRALGPSPVTRAN